MQNSSLPPASRVLAIVVRHGKTKLNNPSAPRLRAWEDPPLSDEGRADIQLAANKIKFYRPKMIYSSDFARDSEGAFIIAEMMGNIPYETAFELRTADMGTLSGMREDEARARVLQWYRNPSEPAPSGESFNNFARRFWTFYDRKLELSRCVAAFRPTVFLTHGRDIAYLDSYYRGLPPEDATMPKPGNMAIVRESPGGMDSMEFIGETEPVQDDV